MRDLDPPVVTRAPRRRPSLALLLAVANSAALAALVYVGDTLLQRLHREEVGSWGLQLAAEADRDHFNQARQDALDEIRQLQHMTQDRIETISRSFLKAQRTDRQDSLERTRLLYEDLTSRQDAAQEEVLVSLRQDMVAIDQRLRRTIANLMTAEESFRAIEREWASSVFMLYSEFTYRTLEEAADQQEHTGTGWGTGFVLSPDGHLITNKHVIQPWKFDPELAAMEALGQLEVDPQSVRVWAWPAGSRCLDAGRELLKNQGYNNASLGNLTVAMLAPDHLITKTMDVGDRTVSYRLHELDDNDLALLRLTGGPFRPLPCAPFSGPVPVEKLDPVMALGFPRGHRGLETETVATSPSLGTVRKIESTIHVTASIIPGNSGGPLFNRKGQVVGMVTRVYSETLGICLKIDHALDLLEACRRAQANGKAAELDGVPSPGGS